ncbi:MAG: SUF system NifU family Fe-S cluster assembly protein [Sphaerochaetaceae bacterium]
MTIEEMYKQVIQAHSNSKRNKRHLAHPTVVQPGVNPSCGDEIVLELETTSDGLIKDISFTGNGCAISQASTSIMADLVRGKKIAEAERLDALFMQMIREGAEDEQVVAQLQEAGVFSTVSHMPARVKCAVLGWHTLTEALKQVGKTT